MKNDIQAIKFSTIVNCMINGKLYSKKFNTSDEASKFFDYVIQTKKTMCNNNINNLIGHFNTTYRIAKQHGFEYDSDTNSTYFPGHTTPIHPEIIKLIDEYDEHGYPVDAILNFAALLELNPDPVVRERCFDFIRSYDFALTDNGYLLTYKAVYEKKSNTVSDSEIQGFLQKVKSWRRSPHSYYVYEENGIKKLTKSIVLAKSKKFIGRLDEIKSETIYTDMHTRTMDIEIGKPVIEKREKCDADHNVGCSNGLHVGATKYVENFANDRSVILICLVNPANIVAIPTYDKSKIRVCEYFPIGRVKYENNRITPIDQSYFESDYINYEKEVVKKMLADIKEKTLPIKTAINAAIENRSLYELEMLVKDRLVVLG